MKRFFYSLWNDLKRNKFFNTLMFAEVLILIILFSVMLSFTKIEGLQLKFYDKSKDSLALVEVKETRDIDFLKIVGKEGVQNVGLSGNKSYFEKNENINENGISVNVCFANPKLLQFFTVPHSGDWFSGKDDGEFKEALVSLEKKSIYEIGKNYTIIDTKEEAELKIKVIGYLGKDNIVLETATLYDVLYSMSYYDMLVCDSSNIDLTKVKYFIADEKPAQFYKDTYNFESTTYKETYQKEKDLTQTSRYNTNYLLAVIVAIIVVCIIANSVFKVEKDIKRNMLKYVVGNSNRNIVLGEIVKSVGIFTFAFLIDLAVVPIVGSIMKKHSLENIITWKNFFISTGIILAIYIFSTFATLMRTILAKPLKELRKD